MTFLKRRRKMLRTTTKRPSVVIFALVAAVVLSVGYIIALAILAPEQLAEATAAATDLVCSGCVGTSDIADSAVTSAKIGSGQVKNSDLGGSAVTTGKISDTNGVYSVDIVNGQVGSNDIATDAVTSAKIGKGQVGSNEIGDNAVISQYIVNGEVKTEDIANDAVKPNVHKVQGDGTSIAPGGSGSDTADCPAGEILTGGGFLSTSRIVRVTQNFPFDENTWSVSEVNDGATSSTLFAYAVCIGPSP
jgi:hypothetical protein